MTTSVWGFAGCIVGILGEPSPYELANSTYSLFKFIVGVLFVSVGIYAVIIMLAHNWLTWRSFLLSSGLVVFGIFIMQDFLKA